MWKPTRKEQVLIVELQLAGLSRHIPARLGIARETYTAWVRRCNAAEQRSQAEWLLQRAF
jgi:hypothetical protein